jgi:hypothetical protein
MERRPLRDSLEMQRCGDERFARASGRVEDDVLVLEQLKDRGFLRGIKLQPPPLRVIKEAFQQNIIAGFPVARNQIV